MFDLLEFKFNIDRRNEFHVNSLISSDLQTKCHKNTDPYLELTITDSNFDSRKSLKSTTSRIFESLVPVLTIVGVVQVFVLGLRAWLTNILDKNQKSPDDNKA